MMTNGEIEAFENFKFKLGDIVVRITDPTADDKGIVVGRALTESTAGVNRAYTVAFESVVHNQQFEEIELYPHE